MTRASTSLSMWKLSATSAMELVMQPTTSSTRKKLAVMANMVRRRHFLPVYRPILLATDERMKLVMKDQNCRCLFSSWVCAVLPRSLLFFLSSSRFYTEILGLFIFYFLSYSTLFSQVVCFLPRFLLYFVLLWHDFHSAIYSYVQLSLFPCIYPSGLSLPNLLVFSSLVFICAPVSRISCLPLLRQGQSLLCCLSVSLLDTQGHTSLISSLRGACCSLVRLLSLLSIEKIRTSEARQ